MRQAIKESVYNDQKLYICAHHSVAGFWSAKDEVILDRKTIEHPDRSAFQQEGHSQKTGRQRDKGSNSRKPKSH
jgi:hypothetical protein